MLRYRFVHLYQPRYRIILMSSILCHFVFFRHELERCMLDVENERMVHIKYLMDVFEQHIRSTQRIESDTPAQVEPRVDQRDSKDDDRGALSTPSSASLPPGLYRIVGGRIQTQKRSGSVNIRNRSVAQNTWQIGSTSRIAWSQTITKASRCQRRR